MAAVNIYALETTPTTADGEIDVIDLTCVGPFQALLPPGVAWTRDADAELTALITALSYEYSRIKRRGRELLEELDPRTTYEMLEDFERVYGLPSDCVVPTTLEGRRSALHARMLGNVDPTSANFIDLAAELDYTATIETYTSGEMFTCVSPCTDPLYGRDWMFVWDVLTERGDDDDALECAIEALSPLHTLVRFFYTLRWTYANNGVATYPLRDVFGTGSLWVIVGDGDGATTIPTIITSLDGVTWVGRTPDAPIGTHLNAVAHNGTNLWVAVGGWDVVNTSPDGITWTTQTASVAGIWLDVAYNGTNLWVATGVGGIIMTSPDGVAWTTRTSGVVSQIQGVAFGNGVWVAVTDAGEILTSPDGVTWTLRTSDTDAALGGVVYHDGVWVVVGSISSTGVTAILVSDDDGVTWGAVNAPDVDSTLFLYRIAVNATTGLLLATGTNDASRTVTIQSTNGGYTWRLAHTGTQMSGNTEPGGIYHADDLWIIARITGGSIARSSD
jgi:uncharacterized protein YmfQ (DUF2313 family)